MIPLPLMGVGSEGIVDSIRGNDDIRKKILDLGLIPGEKLELFSASPGSPVVVKIRGHRIMLDYATSKRVMMKHV